MCDAVLRSQLRSRAMARELRRHDMADGIAYGWGIARYAGFESSGQASVHKVAQVGFDVVSAWMRGEQGLERSLAERVEEISASLIEMHDFYANRE